MGVKTIIAAIIGALVVTLFLGLSAMWHVKRDLNARAARIEQQLFQPRQKLTKKNLSAHGQQPAEPPHRLSPLSAHNQ